MSEEIPYVVIDPGKEETFMLKHICKDCGSTVEFSVAELLRCGDDIDRPRPKCSKCGRPVQIGPVRVWNNESVDLSRRREEARKSMEHQSGGGK